MKTLLSTLLLTIYFGLNSSAQWHIINLNEKYNFFHSSQTDSIVRTTVWVDSTKVINGDSVYYLNKVFKKGGFVSTPFSQNQILIINQTQFLKSKITFLANNVQQIAGDKSYYINGNCSIGDNWIFDSIANTNAICDSLFEINILGFTDSVKRILINLTDTILLSKNYGLLEFPDLDSNNQNYHLVGLETLHLGLTIPNAYDFCNFNIGDEFEFKINSSSTQFTSGAHTSWSLSYNRYRILSRTLNADSITYQVYNKTRSENHPFVQPTTIYVDTGSIDTIVFQLTNSNDFLNSQYNLEYTYQAGGISWCEFERDTIGSGYRKYYYSSNCSVYAQDSILLGSTTPVGSSYHYTKDYSQKLGLLNKANNSYTGMPLSGSGQDFSKQLQACLINGLQFGQFFPDSIYYPYHDCNTDSINLNFIETDKDTLIDLDTIATLKSHLHGDAYLWSNGATTDTIAISKGGNYTLTITNSYGCSKKSVITVESNAAVYNNFILPSSNVICENSSVWLTTFTPGLKYLWSTGSTALTIYITKGGTYCLTTTGASFPGGAIFTATKCITVYENNTSLINWPTDTFVNSNSTITLSLPLLYDTFLWYDGTTTIKKTINYNDLHPGVNTIWGTAYKNDCSVTDTILIRRAPDENDIKANFHYFFINANGQLFFIPLNYQCTYELYSIEGKLVFTATTSEASQVYSTNNLKTGIYLLRITTATESYTGKIFISK